MAGPTYRKTKTPDWNKLYPKDAIAFIDANGIVESGFNGNSWEGTVSAGPGSRDLEDMALWFFPALDCKGDPLKKTGPIAPFLQIRERTYDPTTGIYTMIGLANQIEITNMSSLYMLGGGLGSDGTIRQTIGQRYRAGAPATVRDDDSLEGIRRILLSYSKHLGAEDFSSVKVIGLGENGERLNVSPYAATEQWITSPLGTDPNLYYYVMIGRELETLTSHTVNFDYFTLGFPAPLSGAAPI